MGWIFIIVSITEVLDVTAYIFSKYPDRVKYGHYPGSGFVAIYKVGRR